MSRMGGRGIGMGRSGGRGDEGASFGDFEAESRSLPPSSRLRFQEFRDRKVWTRSSRQREGGDHPEVDRDTRRRYLRQYWQLIRPQGRTIIKLILVGLIAAAIEMAPPAATGLITDKVLLNADLQLNQQVLYVCLACGGLILLLIVSRSLEIYRNISTIRLNHKIVIRLRRKLHRHLLDLPLSTLHEMKTGQIVSRLSGDVDKATSLLQMAVMSPIAAFWRVVYASAVLFVWNWKLAVAVWMILPLMLIISLAWVRKIRPIFRSAGRDRNLIDARATETFSGIRVVRTFRREPRERHDYAVADDTMIRKRLFAVNIALTIDSVWQMLIPAATAIILLVGGLLYLHGMGTIGQIMAFQLYIGFLLQPIFRIVASLNQTQEALASLERVLDVFDRPVDKPDPPEALDAPKQVDEIRFDRVTFAYQPETPIIRDFSLTVPGGSVVALVGPSGAGKTTITNLIARFYDPGHGAILLNGVDLRRIKLRQYRELLAVVEQEVFLFDGTVRQNIAYGQRHATDEQVIEAADRANAMEFINDLPKGLDTIIGERGVKLSGGQRQRLSIARAILADPQILILDEATSNLDTHSEQLIQAALDDLYHNRTTFVIAHRLSTVTHADIIVAMDQGRIVEVGRHDELMRRDGFYREMVERQRQFATESDLA